MDTGSGHIYENRGQIQNVKGKLVMWEVGEEVIIKDCKFRVEEIETIPADKIVLKGMPHPVFNDEFFKEDKVQK